MAGFSQHGRQNVADAIHRKLQVSRSEQQEIEEATRGNTYGTRWFKERRGRITGSKAYKIMEGEDSPYVIVYDIMSTHYQDDLGTRHGNAEEPKAIRKYQQQRRQRGERFKLKECGLVVDLKNGELAATPDGLIDDENGGRGVLEVKCPYGARFMSPNDAIFEKQSNPHFPQQFSRSRVVLKQNHRAFYQVQMEMALTERDWCDFVLYTNESYPVIVVRVPFAPMLWDQIRKKLLQFHSRYVVPELIRCQF